MDNQIQEGLRVREESQGASEDEGKREAAMGMLGSEQVKARDAGLCVLPLWACLWR